MVKRRALRKGYDELAELPGIGMAFLEKGSRGEVMASLEESGDEVVGALLVANLPSPEELGLRGEKRYELESAYSQLWSLGPTYKFGKDVLGVMVPRWRIGEAERAIREIREAYEKTDMPLKPKLTEINITYGIKKPKLLLIRLSEEE
jgi:hypothetical protein